MAVQRLNQAPQGEVPVHVIRRVLAHVRKTWNNQMTAKQPLYPSDTIPAHLLDQRLTYETFAIKLIQGQHMRRSLKRLKQSRKDQEINQHATQSPVRDFENSSDVEPASQPQLLQPVSRKCRAHSANASASVLQGAGSSSFGTATHASPGQH